MLKETMNELYWPETETEMVDGNVMWVARCPVIGGLKVAGKTEYEAMSEYADKLERIWDKLEVDQLEIPGHIDPEARMRWLTWFKVRVSELEDQAVAALDRSIVAISENIRNLKDSKTQRPTLEALEAAMDFLAEEIWRLNPKDVRLPNLIKSEKWEGFSKLSKRAMVAHGGSWIVVDFKDGERAAAIHIGHATAIAIDALEEKNLDVTEKSVEDYLWKGPKTKRS